MKKVPVLNDTTIGVKDSIKWFLDSNNGRLKCFTHGV